MIIRHTCVAYKQENWFITWNKLRNQFRIYQICKKKMENVSLWQKQIENII